MRIRRLSSLLLALMTATGAATAARAQFTYSTFASGTGFNLVGNASVAGGHLRITTGTNGQVGAVWYQTPQSIASGFSMSFTFAISNLHSGGADGFAFVIQNSSPTAITAGGGGCTLGYDGIPNSLALEFDTYQTAGVCVGAGSVNDPNANHLSIHTTGASANSVQESVSIGLYSPTASLKSGTHTVVLNYTPGTLTVTFDGSATPVITAQVNLATELNLTSGAAYLGFTGATGGANEQHDITAWTYTPVTGPLPGDSARPATPTIIQPGTEWQEANPSDVDMSLSAFSSPTGASVLSTDWEIYRDTDGVRVWHATAIPATITSITMPNGVFEGPYAGRTTLENSTNFTIRGRYRDNSGLSISEYSYWSTRNIRTAPPSAVFPYTESDIRKYPLPTWTLDAGNTPIVLTTGASLTLGSAQNDLLARLDGGASTNTITNPAALAASVPVRISITAGASALNLGASTLKFQDASCISHSIYLPALNIPAGTTNYYWVDTSGSTYTGAAADTAPVFTTLARGTVTPWAVRQPGYVVETFASGFQLPVNIAFVPTPGPNPTDVLCYVTELYGQVMMVQRNGAISPYASNLLNYPPTGIFPGSGECGVAGIVIEPTTGDLFVSMLYAVTNGDPSSLRPKIVRMHSTDGGRTMATATTIITFPNEQQGQSHQISNLTFGPDGKLYVHMGDGMDATRGQTITSARGKILRMNLDGTPPTDNPFYTSAPGVTGTPTVTTQLIWLYGVRNPFGGAWRAADSKHYSIENGPSNDRISVGVPGQNYLYTGSDASMANFNILGVTTTPLVSAWYPAHGPVNMAFAQTATFNGSGFPAAKMDHMFASESGPTYGSGPQTLGKRISECVLTPNTGALISGPVPLVEYIGAGQASCVGLAFGPDGLYFTDMYKDTSTVPSDRGANLLRIRYVGSTGPCPACPADFDSSGTLSVQDIFDFLNAWFAGNPRADFNASGSLSVQDIFDYLNAWFAGC